MEGSDSFALKSIPLVSCRWDRRAAGASDGEHPLALHGITAERRLAASVVITRKPTAASKKWYWVMPRYYPLKAGNAYLRWLT